MHSEYRGNNHDSLRRDIPLEGRTSERSRSSTDSGGDIGFGLMAEIAAGAEHPDIMAITRMKWSFQDPRAATGRSLALGLGEYGPNGRHGVLSSGAWPSHKQGASGSWQRTLASRGRQTKRRKMVGPASGCRALALAPEHTENPVIHQGAAASGGPA